MKKDYMQNADILGCNVELRLTTADLVLAEKTFKKMWNEINNFDNNFSRFKNDSELSKFNNKSGKYMQVSNEFEQILKKAKEFASLTEGIFNPFILPSLQKEGYKKSLTNKETGPDYSQRQLIDWRLLKIDKGYAKIPKNSALDLGGIGKGFLADKLASLIEKDIPDYCLSLGGDMRIGGQNQNGPWQVEIAQLANKQIPEIIFSIDLPTWAIATSGDHRTKHNFKQKHIINPATGSIMESGTLCTVIAKDATTADVFATCIIIGGKKLAEKLYQQGKIIGGLIQKKDGNMFILGNGFSKIESVIQIQNNFNLYA